MSPAPPRWLPPPAAERAGEGAGQACGTHRPRLTPPDGARGLVTWAITSDSHCKLPGRTPSEEDDGEEPKGRDGEHRVGPQPLQGVNPIPGLAVAPIPPRHGDPEQRADSSRHRTRCFADVGGVRAVCTVAEVLQAIRGACSCASSDREHRDMFGPWLPRPPRRRMRGPSPRAPALRSPGFSGGSSAYRTAAGGSMNSTAKMAPPPLLHIWPATGPCPRGRRCSRGRPRANC